MSELTFHWIDYLLFSASLGVGLIFGLISMLTGGRQQTKEEYLLGNRTMKVIYVGASLGISYVSASALLGFTAEVHYR